MRGVLDNSSIMGFFAPDGQKVDTTKKKLVLIMDEVDGMSAGDRGGVGQLAALCRKTNVCIPLFIIPEWPLTCYRFPSFVSAMNVNSRR